MRVIIPLARARDARMLQQLVFALGARASGAAFEQLVDQIYEARRRSEEIVERFTVKCDALQAEFDRTRVLLAELDLLRLLDRWPEDRARMQ